MISSLLRGRSRGFGLGAVVAAAWLLFGASPASAQQGAVTGTVTDAGNGEPISGAQVFIRGTNLGTLTSQDGSYRLEGVPTGQQTVRVRLIGYQTASRTVNVSAGQASTADFQLSQTALKLQEVVVTGVAGETPQAKLPFSVDQVSFDEVETSSNNVSSMLQGRVAGAQIVQGSGLPGEEASIQLRGATSINASGRTQGPLIVIDGVIQSDNATLSDINSQDIKNIEVVKGAAAASMYGSRAANGVVQITTRSGAEMDEGSFDLTVRQEYGTNQLPNEIPLLDHHYYAMNESGNSFVDGAGNDIEYGSGLVLDGPSEAQVFADNPWPGETFDNLDRFFDPGNTITTYLAASGRFGETNFRASAENFSEDGVIKNTGGYDRKNVRLNVGSSPSQEFDFQMSGFYSSSEQDDITSTPTNPLFSLTFMSPKANLLEEAEDGSLVIQPDPLSNEPNPIYIVRNAEFINKRQRVMGNGQFTWSPTSWFNVDGNFSYDRTHRRRSELLPKGYKDIDGTTPGELARNNWTDEAINASVTAGINKSLGDFVTRTRVRYLYEDQNFDQVFASGNNFAVEQTPSLGTLTDNFAIEDETREVVSHGYFLISNWEYDGKYIVDLLVRRDGSSLFGPEERWQTYYRGSGAYLVSEENWWPFEDAITNFKLRASYGTAGGRPNYYAQYETYSVGSGGSVSPSNLGNKNLKPEFSKEQEYGVNMTLFDKVALEVVHARSETEDQILDVPLPAFAGFTSQWQNAGTLEAKTWEASLEATPVQTSEFSWRTSVTGSRTTQKITDFNRPPYRWGPENRFYNREGEVFGTFYGTRWATSCDGLPEGTSCSQFEVNDDGYLVWVGEGNSYRDGLANDLWGTAGTVNGNDYSWGMPVRAVEDTDGDGEQEEFLSIGNTQPEFTVSWSNSINWNNFSVYGLFDATVGNDVYNLTRQWGYRERRHGFLDQTGKPEGLKKPIGYYATLYDTNSSNSEFVEDGSYLKLRELSITYSFPGSFLQSAFGGNVERLSLNLIGRNVFTWTDYTGFDPEVGQGGGQAGSSAVNRFDDFNYPNYRTLTAGVEVVF